MRRNHTHTHTERERERERERHTHRGTYHAQIVNIQHCTMDYVSCWFLSLSLCLDIGIFMPCLCLFTYICLLTCDAHLQQRSWIATLHVYFFFSDNVFNNGSELAHNVKKGKKKADHSNLALILGPEYNFVQLKELRMIICIRDVSLLNQAKPLLSCSQDKHLLG